MGCTETELGDDGSAWITKSHNFLFQVKRCPWYLVSYILKYLHFFFCYVLPAPHDLKPTSFSRSLNQLFRKTVLVW